MQPWSVERFSEHVVSKLWPSKRKMPRDIWGATNQWLTYILGFMPYWVVDAIALRMFKLNVKLPKAIEGKKAN